MSEMSDESKIRILQHERDQCVANYISVTEGMDRLEAEIKELRNENERLRNWYSKLYQGIWICPPEEVEFEDDAAADAFSEACRQSHN